MGKPELEVASYWIPSETCSSLPFPVMSQLKKETEQCAVYHVQPTKVAKSYKLSTGKCTLLRHLTLLRPGQMCISKVPVTQCGPSCKSEQSQLVEKSVPFTCMPLASRLADTYMLKAQSGKPLNELLSAATTPLRPRSGQLRQILLRRPAAVTPQHAHTVNKTEKRQTDIRTALNIGKQNMFYIQNIKYAQIPICCVKMIKIF